MSDVVVLVADSSDALGSNVAGAEAMLRGDTIDDQPFEADKFTDRTTAIVVVTLVIARNLLARSYPKVASGLDRQPAAGRVRVIAIVDGTPALIHADIRPNAPIAQG